MKFYRHDESECSFTDCEATFGGLFGGVKIDGDTTRVCLMLDGLIKRGSWDVSRLALEVGTQNLETFALSLEALAKCLREVGSLPDDSKTVWERLGADDHV